MRELTIRLKFTKACLGNVKRADDSKWPRYYLPRNPDGQIRFEAKWWRSSLKFAAEIMNKHHREVNDIQFDVIIDGRPDTNPDNFYKRFIDKKRYIKHEAFKEGDLIGVNCVVPSSISDDELWQLMTYVGQYRGISPFGPKEYGLFTVESIIRTPKQVKSCQ